MVENKHLNVGMIIMLGVSSFIVLLSIENSQENSAIYMLY